MPLKSQSKQTQFARLTYVVMYHRVILLHCSGATKYFLLSVTWFSIKYYECVCVCVCVCILAIRIWHTNRIFSAPYYIANFGLGSTIFFHIIS